MGSFGHIRKGRSTVPRVLSSLRVAFYAFINHVLFQDIRGKENQNVLSLNHGEMT